MRKGQWRHAGVLTTAVLLVIALGIAGLATPHLTMFAMVLVGPVLAASAARPRPVAAVGVVALLVAWATSSWHGLSGTTVQLLGLGVIAATTVLSTAVAHHRQKLEGRGHGAAENRSMLAALVESSEEAIITTDLKGEITTWNHSATRLYGWTAQEAVGRNITMLLPPRRAANLPGIAGIERDVTARKRADLQRRQILERSARAERLESLGQLAGGIAHDFNNLLAINLSYLEFTLEQTTDPDVSNDLVRARASAERARDLTRQLLLFARQEPANAELIDLNAVIDETRTMLQRSLGAHIELIAHLSDEPVTVRADRSRIEQILLNLVINARDAMPDGGVIVMEAERADVPDDPARQPPLPAGTYVRLRVADSGIGIPPEVAAHIFEPFFTSRSRPRSC